MQELFDTIKNVISDSLPKKIKVVGFAWNVEYGKLRVTHSSPIEGTDNWGSDPKYPTSALGWHGRVWIRYSKDTPRFGSDPFSKTLTYPGSGGFGSYSGPWATVSAARHNKYGWKRSKGDYPEVRCYSWDFQFFEDDWPVLKNIVAQQVLFATIAGTNTKKFPMSTSNISWTDPVVAAADKEFVNSEVDDMIEQAKTIIDNNELEGTF